jgi:hypothetical protein
MNDLTQRRKDAKKNMECRKPADLSDEAFADVSNQCRRLAKSEGVKELSPTK